MRYWNPEIETMSHELQKEMQARKLRNMIRQLYYHSPFYRSLFYENRIDPSNIQTVSDLPKLPLTRKEDLVENPKEFILQPNEISLSKTLPLEKRLRQAYDRFVFDEKIDAELRHDYKPIMFVISSGRSSGNPSPIFYTKYDLEIMSEIGGRMGTMADMSEESFFHIAFPAGLHMAFWQCVEAAEAMGCMSIRHGTEKISQQALILERFGVSEVAGIPSFLDALSGITEERGLDCSRLKTVIAAGERFPTGLKKRIKKRLGGHVRIIEAYGASEMKVAFTECFEGSGFHLMPDTHIFEVLDEKTLEPKGEKERGVLAFTHIDFRGSVFLRFLTNDVSEGGIIYEPCECGRTTPRILGPIGRSHEYEIKVEKKKININALDEYLSEILDTYLILVEKESLKICASNPPKDLAHEVEKKFSLKPTIEGVEKSGLQKEIMEKWKGRRFVLL